MFEIKYDRNGQPLPLEKQNMPAELQQPVAQAAEEPRKLHPELQVRDELSQPTVDNLETVEPVADNLSTTEQEPTSDVLSQVAQPVVEEAKVAQEFKVSQENQRNIRYMRERAELADKLERERDELARQLKATQAPQQQEPDTDIGLGENDLAEGKHLSKVTKEIKALKQELNQYKQQSAQATTQLRLKSQFPDFDSVVSTENIQKLGAEYPEIYSTLNSSTDLYATAVSAYTMIKKLGIGVEPSYNADKAQALKNLAKPRPLQSVAPQQGDTPLGRADMFANGLTPELQKQLYREMLDAKKNY